MSTPREPTEQLALLRSTARRGRSTPPKPAPTPAPDRPVARVLVDVGLAHLDRPFDYLVSGSQHEQAVPGARVKVRFAGRLLGGFLLERAEASEHAGRLAVLHSVVSPEPVLSPMVCALAREVATRYAGTTADVLRLAVPPRHARVEAEPSPPGPVDLPARPDAGGWRRYDRGTALVDAVHAGTAARAVWSALPGDTWPDDVARLVLTALAGGRGALVVLPDHRDVARLDDALRGLGAPDQADHHLVLTAELGPAERYRRWLRIKRGQCRAVIGTRAAMFAPVDDLGLAVVWDDGDDLHAEPRAPYPHVRTVLALRSRLESAALVIGGFSRTAEGAALVQSGWAHPVAAPRDAVRRAAPRLRTGHDDPRDPHPTARLPSAAWRTLASGLERGPVLVQVPRAGYVPGLACATCREPARCAACHGPLGSSGRAQAPRCAWCGVAATAWACPRCTGTTVRAVTVGAGRTAEELGRAFPRIPVRSSGGSGQVLAHVDATPALVVATPGAEPVAVGGYTAAVLLDGWGLLARPDLRAGEEALRRWLGAAALVRPAAEAGEVVVLADPAHPAVQALVRWDPATFAERELDERAALHLPPAAVVVSLIAEAAGLATFLDAAELPEATEVLGPVTAGEGRQRVLLRSPRSQGRALRAAVKAAAGVHSAHKDTHPVRVQVDPLEIG